MKTKPSPLKIQLTMSQAMGAVSLIGAKRRVAEARLRFACATIAEELCRMVGEPGSLPGGYRILGVDPLTDLVDTPHRPQYLILVDARETGKGKHTKTYALSNVPADALDRFDFPQAGRLTLTRFAEKLQGGWLIEVANAIDLRTAKLATAFDEADVYAKALKS